MGGGRQRAGGEEQLMSNQTHEYEIFWELWHCVAFVVLSNGAKNSPRMFAAAAPAAADAADDDDYGLMRHIRHTIDAYGSRTPLQSSPLLLQTLCNYCVVAGK